MDQISVMILTPVDQDYEWISPVEGGQRYNCNWLLQILELTHEYMLRCVRRISESDWHYAS